LRVVAGAAIPARAQKTQRQVGHVPTGAFQTQATQACAKAHVPGIFHVHQGVFKCVHKVLVGQWMQQARQVRSTATKHPRQHAV